MKGRGPVFTNGQGQWMTAKGMPTPQLCIKLKKWGNGRENKGRTGWKAKRPARYLLGPYNPKVK